MPQISKNIIMCEEKIKFWNWIRILKMLTAIETIDISFLKKPPLELNINQIQQNKNLFINNLKNSI